MLALKLQILFGLFGYLVAVFILPRMHGYLDLFTGLTFGDGFTYPAQRHRGCDEIAVIDSSGEYQFFGCILSELISAGLTHDCQSFIVDDVGIYFR